jgi:hypothetical protein
MVSEYFTINIVQIRRLLEYPIQVGSDTITACLLDIYFLKYLAVTSPIILLSHGTKISVIPSQHKINSELNFSLITPKVLFTLHLLVTANH